MNKFIGLAFFAFFSICLIACKTGNQTDRPYFGNGFRNGWADQNSIVIWTRLTRNPELDLNGQKFKIPSKTEHRMLDSTANPELINAAQIPKGYTLYQMDGACPGAPGEVKIIYFPSLKPELKIESEWEPVDVDRNFTRQWRLENLIADTKYVVELEARRDKKSKDITKITGAFRTAPDSLKTGNIDFCIVTCQDYNNRDDSTKGHKIYNSMLKMMPDFFVHTGDIEYYDQPEPYALTEELMRFKWDRIFALPYQLNFYKQVTTYFMKDDHDALRNDAYPGMRYGTVTWERGLEIFDKEQFPTNDLPFKTIRWGKDLQIWLMEGRNYRSRNNEPDSPAKTIWGEKQKSWLYKTLNASDATFKLIISPGPILGPDRDNKNDNHSNIGYANEGNEIRKFLNQYKNVFICNGDRHWQYVTNMKRSNLWEFGCGPSSDIHAEGWSQDDLRPEHKFLRVKGGFLKGSLYHTDNVSYLKFQHCDVDGNVVHEELFPKLIHVEK